MQPIFDRKSTQENKNSRYPFGIPGIFIGRGWGIRTPANGVRVRCATVTQILCTSAWLLYPFFWKCQVKNRKNLSDKFATHYVSLFHSSDNPAIPGLCSAPVIWIVFPYWQKTVPWTIFLSFLLYHWHPQKKMILYLELIVFFGFRHIRTLSCRMERKSSSYLQLLC